MHAHRRRGIRDRLSYRRLIAEIRAHDGCHVFEIAPAWRPRPDHGHDVRAKRREAVNHLRSDEPGGAGHEHRHSRTSGDWPGTMNRPPRAAYSDSCAMTSSAIFQVSTTRSS